MEMDHLRLTALLLLLLFLLLCLLRMLLHFLQIQLAICSKKTGTQIFPERTRTAYTQTEYMASSPSLQL